MAYFSKNFNGFTLPDNCPSTSIDIHHASKSPSCKSLQAYILFGLPSDNSSSTSIDIHHASKSHPSSSYKPPFSRPPSGPLNAPGLKARIAYGNNLRKNRDVTSRTMKFIQWWKERCVAMLEASSFMKKKLAKEMDILDDEMQSRYDKIHGEDGLYFTLVEIFNVMAKLRMKAEYGDYLAYTCSDLKSEKMNDLIWKIEKLDWQQVASKNMAEEAIREDDKSRRRIVLSPTPYLDDIAKATSRLGYEESLVKCQIMAYAERNEFCHSGIKALAEKGDFPQLGERIMEDKRSLEVIFRERPHDQIEMRSPRACSGGPSSCTAAPMTSARTGTSRARRRAMRAFILLAMSLALLSRHLPVHWIKSETGRWRTEYFLGNWSLIQIVEKEWFVLVWVDETWKRRSVAFNLTEKGLKKMQSRRPPGEAEWSRNEDGRNEEEIPSWCWGLLRFACHFLEFMSLWQS